ncbi:hypothetical protein B9Z55_013308 [Caenorhabditis nigoni]|uniref:Uncharacterized protein n=2 Tax=Caenorhabditis nigoni TaxID=1611254 RepID=A0A2G5U145_9PELO|nr:hypothetical protein B9Z55_013308 [Caenorhabditis nigoni]
MKQQRFFQSLAIMSHYRTSNFDPKNLFLFNLTYLTCFHSYLLFKKRLSTYPPFNLLKMSSYKPVRNNNSKSTMKTIKDDILPSQIVSDYVKESDGYQKYRIQFREPYKHFLGCVGLDERDWNLSRPRADLRCNALFQQLTSMYSITSKPDFFNEKKEKDTETKEGVDYFGDFDREIRPHFEIAIATENQYYDEMKTKMQVIHDFYTNDFEAKKAEFASLGPELEALQKSRPTDPEQIQQMDKVMNRFTELQRLLKSMIQPGLTAIQSQHLKAMRECMEAYQKLNDNWSNCFVSFSKFKPKLTVKRRIKDEEKGKDKADKLGEDDRDI